jgi:hypothetical protein
MTALPAGRLTARPDVPAPLGFGLGITAAAGRPGRGRTPGASAAGASARGADALIEVLASGFRLELAPGLFVRMKSAFDLEE